MKKKTISLILALVLVMSLCVPALAATSATPTSSTVLVNGKNVAFDAYNIDGNNYFKLRDLAYTLDGTEKQFGIGWDSANNAISLTSGQPYESVGGEMTGKGVGDQNAVSTTSTIYMDGREVRFTAYNIGGNNYFKLRDIGAAFDFGVDWDGARNTIVIGTGKGYTPEGGTAPEGLPAGTPIDINGYSTAITGVEIRDRVNNNSPVAGEIVYVVHFEPGSAPTQDPFVPLASGCELIDKDGNRYKYSGSQFGNGRYYNIQFSMPVTSDISGFKFYWNGQTWLLPNDADGTIPDPGSPTTPPGGSSQYPDFDVVKGDNYFQIYSLPGGNYNAVADYFIYIGDYRGRIDFNVTLSPTGVGNTITDYWDTTNADKDAAYVRLRLSFQITPASYGTTVDNKLTIKIGDWTYTDSLPANGTLHSMTW